MIIRLADCPLQPWKNGLGRTREIAVEPSASGTGDFLWRVSIAEVDSAAPFSCFADIDRYIVLLDGAGFTMTLDDSRTHALTTPFVPFAFPGEAKVDVALAAGATRDFNLMVRRNDARGEVRALHGATTYTPDPAVALLFCARGEVATVAGRLGAGDAWRPTRSANQPVMLGEGAVALVVRVEPRSR
ncbi:MAG: HutD family protein [Rhodanobacter sp.]